MHADAFTACINDAREAVASFLATLLGNPPRLETTPPAPASDDGLLADAATCFLATQADLGATVLLAPDWVGVLSSAMLGEALAPTDPEAADIVRESVAQGYGAMQQALSAHGVALPNGTFDVSPPGDGSLSASGRHVAIAFECTVDDAPLKGWIVLPNPVAPPAHGEQPAHTAEAPHGPAASSTSMTPPSYADLGAEHRPLTDQPNNFDLLAEVELDVTVELGRRSLPLADVLQLTMGSVIELEKLVGEPLEVYANGRLIAEGEAVVIDEQFGVRITSLASVRTQSKVFL